MKILHEHPKIGVLEKALLLFRNNERHRAGAPGSQVAGHLVDRVAEGLNGGVDVGDKGRPDMASSVEDTRHRPPGHARQLGYVVDGGAVPWSRGANRARDQRGLVLVGNEAHAGAS